MKQHPLSEQCPATSKRTGERCQLRVIGGGPCRFHGGSAPQVAAARERRIVLGEAAMAGGGEARSPHEVMLGAMADADAILQQLKHGDLSKRELLTLVGEWADRSTRISKTVLDAKIDERKVELDQQKAAIVVSAMRAAIEVAGAELLPATRDAMLRAFLAALGQPQPTTVVGELE